jgi:hypothetical protein
MKSTMGTKVCTKCHIDLPATLEYWHKQPNGKYGLKSVCKKCTCKELKQKRNSDDYRKIARIKAVNWRKNNHDKFLEIQRRSYIKNREHISQQKKNRYKTDPQFVLKIKERERRYKASGRRREVSRQPDQMVKAKIRNHIRRQDLELRKHDYERNALYREINKEHYHEMHAKRRHELASSYVAQSMRLSVKNINEDIIETRRLIITLKRELRSLNIKIR